MNKILLLFLIASFFAPILSRMSDCHIGYEKLYIINHGTGSYLGRGNEILPRILAHKGLDANAVLDENKGLDASENEGLDDNEELVENDNEEFLGQKESDDNENGNKVVDTVNKDAEIALEDDQQAITDPSEVPKLEKRFEVVLDQEYAVWCFNDLSKTFYDNSEPDLKYSTKTNIVYNGVYGRSLEVKNGNLRRNFIDLLSRGQASFFGNWQISYLQKSGMFSIRILIGDRAGLALSAVSSDPADGVALKKYKPGNPLQQWIIIKVNF